MSSCTLKGKVFYYTLLEGLFRVHPRKGITGIIVCYNLPPNDTRLFSLFDTPYDLYNFIQTFPPEERHFFEVIPGEWRQKAHFDVDVDLSKQEGFPVTPRDANDLVTKRDEIVTFRDNLTKKLTTCISKVLSSLGVDLRDIRIYSSHSTKKLSLHIIVTSFACLTAQAAKRLYRYVVKHMPIELGEFVDPKVYSVLQQFRLLGSCKHGTDRVKRLMKAWYFDDIRIEGCHPYTDYDQFVESLVTWGMTDLKLFPELPEEEISTFKASGDIQIGSLDGEMIAFIVDKVNGETPYVAFRKISGNCIQLTRKRASFCEICQRVHEHESPFIICREDKFTGAINVLYYCGRNKQNIHLLTINKTVSELESPRESTPDLMPASNHTVAPEKRKIVKKCTPESIRKAHIDSLMEEGVSFF